MASPAQPPPELPALQDELLEAILLRLPTAADLARASMTCVPFRRVITDHSFLRRFRTLHPTPLLGITSVTFRAAQPPHPSVAAARAFTSADAADFWCSFFPSIERWRHRDFSDGRALLSAVPKGSKYSRGDFVRDFAVCDPLYRRYRLLPAIPDDLAALVDQPDIVGFMPFLAPPGEDEDDASFRVMCMTQCTTKLVLFVFSSYGGQWHAVTFDGWSALITEPNNTASWSELSSRYYVNRCFCWVIHPTSKLLVLDTCGMEFSAVSLPPRPPTSQMIPMMAFVGTGEGRLGMFTLLDHIEYDIFYLRYTILQNDGDDANQWQSAAIIPLPLNYRYTIMGVAGGYLLLQGIPEDLHSIPLPERPDLDCFSLNLKTLQLEWFCGNRHMIVSAHLYAGFPPSLSPPAV